MSIVATDLRYYGSANHQETDSGTQGGAIDTSVTLTFTDLDAPSGIEVVSTNAADTAQTVTVTFRNAAGEMVEDTKTLNGTTPVTFTGTAERLLKAVKSGSTQGTVTIRKASAGGDLMVFDKTPHEIMTVRRPFYNAAADAAGGSARDYYEKIFIKNTHATLTLTDAQVLENTDATGKITFALATALDDSGTSANRRTAPAAGVTSFDNTPKNVPNGQNLTAGAAIGVWLKLSLAAGDAATNGTYVPEIAGTTV